MQSKIRYKVQLAALLHDIGKFYQRADSKKDDGSFTFLKSSYWNNPGTFCPYYTQSGHTKYTHKHVLWTAQFIEEHKSIFNQLDIDAFSGEDSLIRLAALHHKPESVLQRIIQKADHYSSGTDRTKNHESLQDGLDQNWDTFKKKRMVPIFEGIMKNDTTYQYALPVDKESLDISFFPKKISEFTQNPDYQSLWERFIFEFKQLPHQDFEIFFTSLLSLTEKYWITIPSSTMHLPDVSLFDHSKTVVAFSVAIYDFLFAQNRLDNFDLKDNELSILMLGADLSGIQKFIYEIVSKNAAKNLKGRSFYLQILVDSVLQHMLHELELTPASIIYSSGGGFFLLAGNTDRNQQKVKALNLDLGERIYERHGTQLFLAMDMSPIAGDVIMHQAKNTISESWAELIQKLNTKKRQKFAHQLVTHYDEFFGDATLDHGGKQTRDVITGEELTGPTKQLKAGEFVSPSTYEQIELGKQLYRAEYMVIYPEPISKIFFQPLGLAYCYHFRKASELDLPKIPAKAKIIRFNNLDFLHSRKDLAYTYRFYGGNIYPVDEYGNPKSFDKLATTGELKRLGILRMDVDNLGLIFKNGFPKNKRTFSRYASLSRSLDYFFKGYLNKIQAKHQNTLILYAGGDDLFMLGNWIEVLEMAEQTQQAYKAWTGQNPKLSLSGGMALVTPKFPILKAAILAADEEKNAKKYTYSNKEKNAFSLFGTAMSWDSEMEFNIVKSLKFRALGLLDADILPKSFYGLISSFEEKRKYQTENNLNESWQWQLAYMLSRFIHRNTNQQLKDFINEVKIDVFANTYKGKELNGNYKYLELLNIAIRWAEFEFRSTKN